MGLEVITDELIEKLLAVKKTDKLKLISEAK